MGFWCLYLMSACVFCFASRFQGTMQCDLLRRKAYISNFLPPEAPTFVIYRTSISLSCRKKATSHARRQHVRVDIKSVTQSTINLFVHLTHISACAAAKTKQEWD